MIWFNRKSKNKIMSISITEQHEKSLDIICIVLGMKNKSEIIRLMIEATYSSDKIVINKLIELIKMKDASKLEP